MNFYNNIIGQKFGKLLVIEKTDKRYKRRIIWKCQCDCGNICEAVGKSLINGDKRSCGCLHKEFISNLGKKTGKLGLARKYTLDHDFFELIDSEEKAYWLGFVLADGYVNPRFLKIGLKFSDKFHLEKFKKDIEYTGNLQYYEQFDKRTDKIYKQAIIKISSPKLINDLHNLGLDNNKSFTAKVPYNIPDDLMRHFWRGIFDGDGCIHGKSFYISLVGTLEIINGFQTFIKFYKTPIIKKNVYEIVFYKESKNILDLLYKNTNVYLDRKYSLWLEMENKK